MGRFPHVSPEPRRDRLRLSSGGEPQTHGRATGIKTSRRRREERTKKKNHSAVSGCRRCTRNGYWETQLASQAKLPLAASGLCFLGSDVLIALRLHGPSRSDASLRALRVARTHGTEEVFFSRNKVDEWAWAAAE